MTNIQLTWRWIRRHTSWLFGIALVLILVGNFLFRPLARPSMAASPLAHSIGILGSSLILLAQIYSVRKRTRLIKAGRMRTWLSWHTFLALVGCVLVEVHAGPFFYGIGGLARVTMWLVVLSGISGRYIYALIPEAMLEEVEAEVALSDEEQALNQEVEGLMQRRMQAMRQIEDVGLLTVLDGKRPRSAAAGAFTSWTAFRDMLRFNYFYLKDLAAMRREIETLYHEEQASVTALYEHMFRRIDLERGMARLMVADEAIRVWRLTHIPPRVLLLVLTLAHVWTRLYY